MESQSDSKRLAKNTIVLYFRTLVMMFIGFYTSRVILNALGIENYGINNVVAGFIAMFSVVSGTLTATTQRYLTCEIGKENGNPKKMFGVAMNIHILLSVFLFVLFETVGVFFLKSGLNIPVGRLYAAKWVYQFTVFSTLISIVNSPYIGAIIAHEKMSTFAYFSLYDCAAKLLICFLLYVTPYDRLITYSAFFFVVGLSETLMYNYYCRKHFQEARFSLVIDKPLYKEMFSFAGMNFIGAFASIICKQGADILLNLFYGVTLNAAIGIANQIQSIATRFVGDFMTSLKPQITKEYACGNREKSMELALRGAKFSFFLTLILACPIFVQTPYILEFWLKVFPVETVLFSRLTIILTMLVLLSDSLVTVILATGNLTSTTWWIGGIRLMTLPLAYIALLTFDKAYMVLIVQIVIEVISLFVRLFILNYLTKLNAMGDFVKRVLNPVLIVASISIVFTYFVHLFVPKTFGGLCVLTCLSFFMTLISIYYLGLMKSERISIKSSIKRKLEKKNDIRVEKNN